MVSVLSPIKEMTADEFSASQTSPIRRRAWNAVGAAAMLPRDRGRIASDRRWRIAAFLSNPHLRRQHAVQGFCDSLRSELIHDGSRVTVTMVQLPALNTPQFDWVKSRMPNRAQPVHPFSSPRLRQTRSSRWPRAAAARSTSAEPPSARSSATRSRQVCFDRYLGATGYAAQQSDEPEDPHRADNLWSPFQVITARMDALTRSRARRARKCGCRTIVARSRWGSRRSRSRSSVRCGRNAAGRFDGLWPRAL
jgi:hypothetical protein